MDNMVSFSPEDVIFLLNKWDTIAHENHDKLDEFFEKTKTSLRQLWKEVKMSCIFKISAVKVQVSQFLMSVSKMFQNHIESWSFTRSINNFAK